MTASGNKFELLYDGSTYTFDSMQLTFGAHIEDTPLLNGDIYRARAASGKNNMRLKGRFFIELMSSYTALITAFATGKRDFALNDETFTGWSLLSAKLTSDENEPFLTCDMVLAEVDV